MSGLPAAPPRRLRLAATSLLLCAAACASAPRGAELVVSELRDRGLSASLAEPLVIDAEMRDWVRHRIGYVGPQHERVRQLLHEILTRQGVPFRYVRGSTTSARDAWSTGAANCLTFSHLFVGLAREIGLGVYYLRVRDLATFDRQEGLIVASEHVTAAYGPGAQRLVLEFSDRPVKQYTEVEPISDLTALALHYSNQGAELIRSDNVREARERLDLAVKIDPDLGDAWLNLGVARRRLGDLEGAESAYRRALEVTPEMVSAFHNLAALLETLGRRDEASELVVLAAGAGTRNPWTLLALGDLALRNDRLPEAERFYRRARQLDPKNPETWAALGDVAIATDDVSAARRYLRRATALDAANPRVRALDARLKRPHSS